MKTATTQIIEIAGVASVVMSLIFVGYEIRQSTNVAKSDAYQQFHLTASEWNANAREDERIQLLMAEAFEGKTLLEFTFAERFALLYHFNSNVRMWAGLFFSVESGILPEDSLSAIGGGGMLELEIFNDIWPIIRNGYDQNYALFIESIVSAIEN